MKKDGSAERLLIALGGPSREPNFLTTSTKTDWTAAPAATTTAPPAPTPAPASSEWKPALCNAIVVAAVVVVGLIHHTLSNGR